MATRREHPYVQFNFLVDLGDDKPGAPHAGFQECTTLGLDSAVAEYGQGKEKEQNVRKIAGLNKSTDVTLKRGIMGSRSLNQWLNDIRQGNKSALRNVVVHLQNEDHSAIVQSWRLARTRIIKHISGPLNAKGTDMAVEELTLVCERLEFE